MSTNTGGYVPVGGSEGRCISEDDKLMLRCSADGHTRRLLAGHNATKALPRSAGEGQRCQCLLQSARRGSLRRARHRLASAQREVAEEGQVRPPRDIERARGGNAHIADVAVAVDQSAGCSSVSRVAGITTVSRPSFATKLHP